MVSGCSPLWVTSMIRSLKSKQQYIRVSPNSYWSNILFFFTWCSFLLYLQLVLFTTFISFKCDHIWIIKIFASYNHCCGNIVDWAVMVTIWFNIAIRLLPKQTSPNPRKYKHFVICEVLSWDYNVAICAVHKKFSLFFLIGI